MNWGYDLSSSTYGPEAIATPANLITLVRTLATPLMVLMILNRYNAWLVSALWLVLALTDGADGWIARRQGATRSGAFLDPLADKVMVFGVLGVLIYQGRVPYVPVLLMGAREIAISIYRGAVAAKGISVPARWLGKWKMIVQLLAIWVVLIPVMSSYKGVLVPTLIWIATALALASGVQYYFDAVARGRTTSP